MPVRDGQTHEYFDCLCNDSEHVLKVVYDPDADFELFCIEIHLCRRGFFRRLVDAVKHVFGYQSRYGAFGCWSLHDDDVVRLHELVGKYRHDLAKSKENKK